MTATGETVAVNEIALVTEENQAVNVVKTKKAKEPKSKKRSPASHPPYVEMIQDAIVSLKEKTGSSKQALEKFIENKQKNLPPNFKKLLLTQLKKLVASGKLVKVKGSFKLAVAAPVKKKPAVTSKPKPVKAAAKEKKVATKTKVVKPKAAAKAKPAAKPKAVPTKTKVVSKAKVVAKPKKTPVKAARTSTRSTPGRKVVAPKAATKKTPVKKAVKSVKPKTVKSPAKKAVAARKGKK